jgi:hypothetical protein
MAGLFFLRKETPVDDRLISDMCMQLSVMTDLEDLGRIQKAVNSRIGFLRSNQGRKPGVADKVEFKMGSRFVRGQIKRIAGRDAMIQEEVTGRPFNRVPLERLRIMSPSEAVA